MAVTLVVSMVGREPQSITLELPRIVIGRAAHADVRLPSRSVSELHAVLHKDGNELAILDEQSSNGTRVNGVSLPRGRRKMLADGDVITIAPYILRVSQVIAQPDPPERTASLARRLLRDALTSEGDEAAPPRLVLLTGKHAGQAWVLPPGRMVLGRDAGCDVCLDERDCSRQHAEVLRGEEGSLLRDLASKNGLIVGGRPVHERRLRHGDEVTIGKTTLRYHDPVEELLRALESGADAPPPPEPPPEPTPSTPAVSSPAPAVSSPAPAVSSPAPAVSSPAPAVSSPASAVSSPAPAVMSPAPAVMSPAVPVVSPSSPATVSASLAAAASRGNFDWIVVVLAVIVLVVSVVALVMLLQGNR